MPGTLNMQTECNPFSTNKLVKTPRGNAYEGLSAVWIDTVHHKLLSVKNDKYETVGETIT